MGFGSDCGCVGSLTAALGGWHGRHGMEPAATTAPVTSCLWCGERVAEPEAAQANPRAPRPR